jgi:hypothetical protein
MVQALWGGLGAASADPTVDDLRAEARAAVEARRRSPPAG